ncbi:MAG: cAMP-binding protein [Caulobacteraceae bacterium]|jgi:CRP-like cAMP-binding protein|nr:cAMP-binding protein [Caulobacteraceae bacterium]
MTHMSAAVLGRPAAQGHRSNQLLASLSSGVLDQLIPDLSLVDLMKDAVVSEAREPASQVLFPHTGVVSIIAMDAEGQAVEVATVGREGATGLPVVLGGETMSNSAVVQIAGRASRIKAGTFRRAVETIPELKRLMLRYALAVFTQISQNAACNQLHAIDRRCARWLLTAHDRVDGDTFELTQNYLAMMLGVTRPSVSAAASALQNTGLIRYSRGRLTILDRHGLEEASCDCYRIIEDEFDRLREMN